MIEAALHVPLRNYLRRVSDLVVGAGHRATLHREFEERDARGFGPRRANPAGW
jgi:hypothetical protein